jgi:hypothetical protein
MVRLVVVAFVVVELSIRTVEEAKKPPVRRIGVAVAECVAMG